MMGTDSAIPETLEGSTAFCQGLQELVSSARLQLALVSVDLDRSIYGTAPLVDVIRQFLLSQRRAQLRVLVHLPRAAMRSGHRLVELGRALSSRVEFRQTPDDRLHNTEEYLISDDRALLIRGSPQDLESRLYRVPAEARLRCRLFEQAWNEAVPARELSELRL